jgi:hypothetical protein
LNATWCGPIIRPTNISDRLTLPVIWHLLGWQLLLNFFPSPLANNFWTDLIFYLVSYVAFASMFTGWKVWMHSDKNKSEEEEHKSGPFLFPFTGFGAVPSPLLFCLQSPSSTCFALLKTSSSAEKKTLG